LRVSQETDGSQIRDKEEDSERAGEFRIKLPFREGAKPEISHSLQVTRKGRGGRAKKTAQTPENGVRVAEDDEEEAGRDAHAFYGSSYVIRLKFSRHVSF
jgi:hypothetical protein